MYGIDFEVKTGFGSNEVKVDRETDWMPEIEPYIYSENILVIISAAKKIITVAAIQYIILFLCINFPLLVVYSIFLRLPSTA